MYKLRKILQVVGHTPVDMIEKKGNIISCDVVTMFFEQEGSFLQLVYNFRREDFWIIFDQDS